MREPTTSEPRRLGDFEIVREIGRGGMGAVYEARQVSLKRRVALKVLSGQLGLTSQAIVRFRREAEAAAKLHHTNIVPIYATGEENGTHYYAMELIEGPSLNILIRELRHRARPVKSTPAADERPATHEALDPTKSETVRGPPAQEGATTTLPPWVMETIGGPTGHIPGPATGNAGSLGTGSRPASDQADRPSDRLGRTPDGSTTRTTAGGHFDTIARLIAEVADALDYAHKQGVIHRDIKPSNLLLSGGVPLAAVGQRSALPSALPPAVPSSSSEPRRRESSPYPKLSINDFGLARVLEQPGMTLTGEFMGTPRYMSPEQIAAGRAPLDHRTDIYSLGATLYELLTLEPAFPGERREQVIAQILHKDPTPPRRINKRVPVDLETICLKALEKDPDRRYQTAGQMADDLRRYVNRFAISARRAGPVARLAKWCRRRPAVAALTGAVVVLAIVAAVFAYSAQLSRRYTIELQRRRAIDDALLAATSWHFDEAEAGIQKAASLGASPGWVCILRGQVALQRGDAAKAVMNLERAAQLLPASVAARGLLARAYAADGQSERYHAMVAEVERLAPTTPEDFLFRGFAEVLQEAARAVQTLEEAVRRRDSSLGRVLLADARSNLASLTGRLDDVQTALDEVGWAKRILPNNGMVLRTHLYAQLVAAEALGAAGQAARRDAALAEADQDARLLERFTGITETHRIRAWYFDVVGRGDLALAERWRWAEANGDWRPYAEDLYRQGAVGEALVALDRIPERMRGVNYYVERAPMLAELPGRYEEALLAAEAAVSQTMAMPSPLEFPQNAFLLLARKADALRAARQLRERMEPFPTWAGAWYKHLLDYTCGTVSDEELLRLAGRSRWNQCEAHYCIGVNRLADGDRAGAAEHFRQARDTHVFNYFEYHWSERLLHRMEQDSTWPPWIPLKDCATSRPETQGGLGGRDREEAP